jgi:hypothetical protein
LHQALAFADGFLAAGQGFLTGLIEFGFEFRVSLADARLFGLEGVAGLADAFAEFEEFLAALFEVGGELRFLALESGGAFLQLALVERQRDLLGHDGGRLDAEGVAFPLDARRFRDDGRGEFNLELDGADVEDVTVGERPFEDALAVEERAGGRAEVADEVTVGAADDEAMSGGDVGVVDGDVAAGVAADEGDEADE